MEEIYRYANKKFWELYKKVKSGNYTPKDVHKKNSYRNYCKRMEKMYCVLEYLPNGYRIESFYIK